MQRINFLKYIIPIIGLWTITIGFTLYKSILEKKQQVLELEQTISQIAFQKDLMYRKWVSKQGGVYVHKSAHTPPNPYLKFIKKRDLITTEGDSLTLVNPAYMTRQVFEYSESDIDLPGHLTSLNPINPINTPSKIEKEALLAFEKGDTLFIRKDTLQGKIYIRYIRPFKTEQSCLKCHAQQGYKVGDIRGALSIAVPNANLEAISKKHIESLFLNYLILWLVGVFSLLLILNKLRKQFIARQNAEIIILQRNMELKETNNQLHAQVEEIKQITEYLDNSNKNLLKSEEKYRLLAENLTDVIWILNITKNKFTYISPSVYNLTGFTVEESITQSIEGSLSPDSAKYILEKIPIAIKAFIDNPHEKKHYYNEIQQLCKNGEYIWLETIIQPQYSKEGDIEFLGVSRNIEKRKQDEMQLQKYATELSQLNQDKDRFIKILAHDLKSPFSSILGFLDLLKKNISTYDIAKIEKQLQIITSAAQNTYKLLEDILLWIKANSGKIPFEPQETDASEVCKNVVENMNLAANNKQITIHNFVESKLVIRADKNMLTTILRNLISNAIKFTNHAGIIDISVSSNEQFATFIVSDNGVGIDSDALSKIFDISHSHSTQGTHEEKGTGFGLLLCKEFVEKHGGNIWVESEPDKGSKFYFSIPLYI